mmetsp:Transcript_19876/g.35453  ORF Transcript_19876/g.35453 Transcript_19876/m.35453 type:complete len:451 (-) Transcript_19876:157-1509(-)|eukprot:CAMPEP_0197530698 /NCGR_PEP_ID=MMETSP1318-20131121/32670_1 /TAXON_ID=552666 /ORGANISM="Partenskyella glossopodia, Strain RCC365" /LENGTH=450 /DNA_ID=CAMNT_0043086635 /DNA_START=103 /DNA_END=1455 /DNA_ORIENTATION=-
MYNPPAIPVDTNAEIKMSLHAAQLAKASPMLPTPAELKLPLPPAGQMGKPMMTHNDALLKSPPSPSKIQQGWFVQDDKWGRFRFTKGAAKKGCNPVGTSPVWFCSKCKDETGKDGLLTLNNFMPYGPECGNPNDKENNKTWSKYMLSGCVYLCRRHADMHIAFMKQRREEVAEKKKAEAAVDAARNHGQPGNEGRKFKTPKKQDLSMKKLQNTLTNVLKKFSPKASIAVLMTHEDDPGNLASFHVGNALDSFCSDAYVRSLFLLCGSRTPQGQHLGVINQGHDLIYQQMQNVTKQYGLLVRQLQNVTRQQQVQNITKQYGLIVSQLQNVARTPGVPGIVPQTVQGVPAMPAMGVTGMSMGVESQGVAMPSAQLAGQVPFVSADGTGVPDAKARELAQKAAMENRTKFDQKTADLANTLNKVSAEKMQVDMSQKRPRDDPMDVGANKRPKQ